MSDQLIPQNAGSWDAAIITGTPQDPMANVPTVRTIEPTPVNTNYEELIATWQFTVDQLENMSQDELIQVIRNHNNVHDTPKEKAKVIIPWTEDFNQVADKVAAGEKIDVDSLIAEAENLLKQPAPTSPISGTITPPVSDPNNISNEDKEYYEKVEQLLWQADETIGNLTRAKNNLEKDVQEKDTLILDLKAKMKEYAEDLQKRELSWEYYIPKEGKEYNLVTTLRHFNDVKWDASSQKSVDAQFKLLNELAQLREWATWWQPLSDKIAIFRQKVNSSNVQPIINSNQVVSKVNSMANVPTVRTIPQQN